MNRLLALLLLLSLVESEGAEPGLRVAVSATAPPEVREAGARLLEASSSHPLLGILSTGGKPAATVDTQALLDAPLNDRALSNLVVLGTSDDPMVRACSQREARFEKDRVIYVFGFGYFQGDIGYIESERNPFLHSSGVAKAPYAAHVVVLTGTTPKGVALAVEAFLRDQIINGVAAAGKIERTKRSLMEAEPWTPEWRLPAVKSPPAPWKPIGVTLAGGTELSGVLEAGGELPERGVRIKYWRPGVWKGEGNSVAVRHFQTGLHRRSAGNTLAVFEFDAPVTAAKSAPPVAIAADLESKSPSSWNREREAGLLGGGIWRQTLEVAGPNHIFGAFQK